MSYEPKPKNIFVFRVNGEDLYSLTKEEVDFDPSKIESLKVTLKVNDIEAISDFMSYIIEDVEEKIQSALGTNQLSCLEIHEILHCKPWVLNEFLDLLTCYDIPEQGLDRFVLNDFVYYEHFEDEVLNRLANICPRISHL